jgi:hypothetical protein
VALVVGPVLFFVNHFDHLVHGRWPPDVATKLVLTFLVPFAVSLYSSSAAARVDVAVPEPSARRAPSANQPPECGEQAS